jgi:hypothetical protein
MSYHICSGIGGTAGKYEEDLPEDAPYGGEEGSVHKRVIRISYKKAPSQVPRRFSQ